MGIRSAAWIAGGLALAAAGARADTIAIGNASALSDWNRAKVDVRVFDSSAMPIPIRDIATDQSSGKTAELSDVTSPGDGLDDADARVDGYDLGGRVETTSAPETLFVAAQLRDQILVEADFDENTFLELELTLDYTALADATGEASFQFTLFAQKPDASFLLLDDVSAIDFGLGTGPLDVDDSRTFTVTTAASGSDDVVITSGTYVPLQLTLTGEASGTTDFDFLSSLELTDFAVKRSSDGTAWNAEATGLVDPANPLVNTTRARARTRGPGARRRGPGRRAPASCRLVKGV